MTKGSDDSENHPADQWTGMLFDSELEDSTMSEDADKAAGSMSQQQLQRMADLHLVHSLLGQLSDSNASARERRIQRVMGEVRSQRRADGTKQAFVFRKLRDSIRPFIRYGIAAVVLLSLTILLTQMGSNDAVAAMDKMIAAIDQAGDRTYRISVKASRAGRGPRPNRLEQTSGPQRQRAVLDDAVLYLRGNDRFVLYRQTPGGQTVISGSDGTTRWLIRPGRPVLVSDDPDAFRIPMPDELAGLLTLDFKATLSRIRDNYRIKYLSEAPPDQDVDSTGRYLAATKRNNRFRGPRHIRIWADSRTGTLERLEFVDVRLQGYPEPQKVVIELVSQNTLSADWFNPESHHSSQSKSEF